MNSDVLNSISSGRAVLFLGAGASLSCLDRNGNPFLGTSGVVEELKNLSGLKTDSNDLRKVYQYAKNNDPLGVENLLNRRFSNSRPCSGVKQLVSYPWRRIYTLNIDDAVEQACTSENRAVRVFLRTDRVSEPDPGFEELQLIKLNGCSRRVNDGVIFSEKEYTRELVKKSPWYTALGSDFHEEIFVFIGTTLDEPVFRYHVENYSCMYSGTPKAYLIVPELDELDVMEIESNNIIHLPGTLSDFTEFLVKSFPNGVDFENVAKRRNPSLASFGKDSLAETVITVSRSELLLSQPTVRPGAIRDFYRGFKISWRDVIDGVYADIDCVTGFYDKICSENHNRVSAIVLKGNAGSGKTTALKASAISLADSGFPVYFVDSSNIDDIRELVHKVEKACSENQLYFIFIDRVDDITVEFNDLVSSGMVKNGVVVTAIQDRHAERLGFEDSDKVSFFESKGLSKGDAEKILKKLEKYGPFHKLTNKTAKERVDLLVKKSRRQLLIGLLEATLGEGYRKIIKNEYSGLDASEKAFVQIVGLSTAHRVGLSATLAERALRILDIGVDLRELLSSCKGIVALYEGKLTLRHQTYADELQKMTTAGLLRDFLYSLVFAFTEEDTPVAIGQSKYNYSLFKRLVNYKYVLRVLKGDKDQVVDFYSSFEKPLENDGMYWLHYGLSLRKLGEHEEAYAILKTGYEVYDKGYQTRHAFSQQELILAHQSDDKDKARVYLESALEKLHLDSVVNDRSRDYDIVLKSEFHVAISSKLDGLEEARKVANIYLKDLQKRSRSNYRVRDALSKITKFISTGKTYTLNYEFDL